MFAICFVIKSDVYVNRQLNPWVLTFCWQHKKETPQQLGRKRQEMSVEWHSVNQLECEWAYCPNIKLGIVYKDTTRQLPIGINIGLYLGNVCKESQNNIQPTDKCWTQFAGYFRASLRPRVLFHMFREHALFDIKCHFWKTICWAHIVHSAPTLIL